MRGKISRNHQSLDDSAVDVMTGSGTTSEKQNADMNSAHLGNGGIHVHPVVMFNHKAATAAAVPSDTIEMVETHIQSADDAAAAVCNGNVKRSKKASPPAARGGGGLSAGINLKPEVPPKQQPTRGITAVDNHHHPDITIGNGQLKPLHPSPPAVDRLKKKKQQSKGENDLKNE